MPARLVFGTRLQHYYHTVGAEVSGIMFPKHYRDIASIRNSAVEDCMRNTSNQNQRDLAQTKVFSERTLLLLHNHSPFFRVLFKVSHQLVSTALFGVVLLC